MNWIEVTSIAVSILLLFQIVSLQSENKKLREQNVQLLKQTGKYTEMQDYAKTVREHATDVETIRILRNTYDLSLLDAKQLVDSLK